MTRHTFGEPVADDDILEVQGVDYRMNPIGMRAMRRLLDMQKKVGEERDENAPASEEDLDLAIDIALQAVRPEERERFAAHIEESVPPNLLLGIAQSVMGSFSDLDPTQPGSASEQSLSTGPSSTDGVSDAALIPTS